MYHMFGPAVFISYLGMIGLLFLQYFSNKTLKNLQMKFLEFSDERIRLVSQIIKGIRAIKVRVCEQFYYEKIAGIRTVEIKEFNTYCNIKVVCSAIYFNAGVILSGAIFMIVDAEALELGKVFSTLSLLGYIFNFSVLYSNYAVEALFQLNVFYERIELAITKPYE